MDAEERAQSAPAEAHGPAATGAGDGPAGPGLVEVEGEDGEAGAKNGEAEAADGEAGARNGEAQVAAGVSRELQHPIEVSGGPQNAAEALSEPQGLTEASHKPPRVEPDGEAKTKARMARRYPLAAAATLLVGVALAAIALAAIGSSESSAPKPAALPASQVQDRSMRALWRTQSVEQLFPASVAIGSQYLRLGIADAAGCDVLPKEFVTELTKAAPQTKCVKVLRSTYSDVTQTVFATVGIVVIDGGPEDREKVWRNWTPDADSRRPELMPGVFAVPGTAAARWTDQQRTVWNSQASVDGSYLVYVVSAFADGRPGTSEGELRFGTAKSLSADSPPVQAALGLSQHFATQFDEAGKK